MPTRADQRRRPVEKTPSNVERGDTATPSTLLGRVVKALGLVSQELLSSIPQDSKKGNIQPILGELYVWREIAKYAKGKYDTLAKVAKEQNVLDLPGEEDDALSVGDHVIAESRHFVVTVNVSNPVRRFNSDVFAQELFESNGIPVIVTKEKLAKARVPGKSQVKVVIIERE